MLTIGSFLFTVEFSTYSCVWEFLLTIAAFAITIGAFVLGIGAFLLTMGSFLLTLDFVWELFTYNFMELFDTRLEHSHLQMKPFAYCGTVPLSTKTDCK